MDINRLLDSKRVEITLPDLTIDKNFVKQFRVKNNMTQATLANILGVTKKTIEKWEQGKNNIGGSSVVLLKLLNDNPELINNLYKVNICEGKREVEEYTQIESKQLRIDSKSKTATILKFPLVAML